MPPRPPTPWQGRPRSGAGKRRSCAPTTGCPRSAVGAELARAVDRFEPADGRVHCWCCDGMRMDVRGIVAPVVRVSGGLLSAASRGAVGILSMHCFGALARRGVSERFALRLATGLQLTNILRGRSGRRPARAALPSARRAGGGGRAEWCRIWLPINARLPKARALLGVRARAAFAEAALDVSSHSRARILPAADDDGPLRGSSGAAW